MARHNAETGGPLWIEPEALAAHEHLALGKFERQIHEEGVMLGDCEVVHHHRLGDVDRHGAQNLALRIRNGVLHIGRLGELIAEKHHLARDAVHLGMGGKSFDGCAKVELPDRFQARYADFVGVACFPQGQQLAVVPNKRCVRCMLGHHAVRLVNQRFNQFEPA